MVDLEYRGWVVLQHLNTPSGSETVCHQLLTSSFADSLKTEDNCFHPRGEICDCQGGWIIELCMSFLIAFAVDDIGRYPIHDFGFGRVDIAKAAFRTANDIAVGLHRA
jgi:hypothetical protein